MHPAHHAFSDMINSSNISPVFPFLFFYLLINFFFLDGGGGAFMIIAFVNIWQSSCYILAE